MGMRYNPPPNWPQPPAGWIPPPDWQPDPAWGPAPAGWQLWIEDPPAPKRRRPWGWVVGLVVAFFLGVAAGGAGNGGNDAAPTASTDLSSPSQSSATEAPAEDAATTSSTPIVAPTAAPDASYTESCDYVLGDFSQGTRSGFRFVAQAKIENTGNVAVVADVVAKWEQVGAPPIKKVKQVTVEWKGRKSVNITVLATSDQIDLHQSYNGTDSCSVKVKLVNTVGDAHPT